MARRRFTAIRTRRCRLFYTSLASRLPSPRHYQLRCLLVIATRSHVITGHYYHTHWLLLPPLTGHYATMVAHWSVIIVNIITSRHATIPLYHVAHMMLMLHYDERYVNSHYIATLMKTLRCCHYVIIEMSDIIGVHIVHYAILFGYYYCLYVIWMVSDMALFVCYYC